MSQCWNWLSNQKTLPILLPNSPPSLLESSNSLHCFRVHCSSMRNVTLSAEEELIERARLIARERHTTLNEAFREWLTQFTSSNSSVEAFDDLMDRLKGVNAGRHFTRDELNER